jgi:hypothetical protein
MATICASAPATRSLPGRLCAEAFREFGLALFSGQVIRPFLLNFI